MAARIAGIAEALTGDEDAWAEEDDRGSGEVLGDYAWEPGDEDGFVPEGWIWMATKAAGGRRIVLWAVLDGYVCFIANPRPGASLDAGETVGLHGMGTAQNAANRRPAQEAHR